MEVGARSGGGAILDAAAGCCTCGHTGTGASSWSFFSSSGPGQWERRHSTLLGYHLIVTKAFLAGEVILEEPPLVTAPSAAHGCDDPDWAGQCLNVFCAASAATQATILAMFSGGVGSQAYADADAGGEWPHRVAS